MEPKVSCWFHVGYRTSLPTIPTVRDKTGWYAEHRKHIELSKLSRGGHVLLIGDDFIESLAHHPKVWSKYFGPLQSLNYGLSGDRTQHVLWRVENGAIPVNAETIVIHAGANNLLYDRPQDIAGGIGSIALMCLKNKPNVKIILTGLLPFDVNTRKKIRKVNKYLKLLCLSGHIPNCFYVKPDDDWLLPDGSLNVLYYCNGLLESGMDKFAKSISDVVTSTNIGVKIEMSSDSDISSDEDVKKFSLHSTSQNKTIKTESIASPVKPKLITTNRLSVKSKKLPSRSRKESSSTNKSITPCKITHSRQKSRSHSSKRNSISEKSKPKDSCDNKHSSKSRSRSRSTSRSISPVFTGRRCRSHCRSRSKSTSRVTERERWCERANQRVLAEGTSTDSFEVKSIWSLSTSISPSPCLAPTKNNSKENLKISIANSLPTKDEKRKVKKTSKKKSPPSAPPKQPPVSVPKSPLPTLPEPESDSTQHSQSTMHMYDKFLKELAKINKKECNYPSLPPAEENLNGN